MLGEDLIAQGGFLFRWRSYVPLLLLPLVVAGYGGFAYPFDDHRLDLAWEGVCLAVALAGQLVRVLTVGFVPTGTSGRRTREQRAEELNVTGMYGIVRHPLYLGNFLIWTGLFLFFRSPWISLFVALVYWAIYERIMLAEERFLDQRFGDAFRGWAARVPAVVPRRLRWTPPELPFSPRTVLRRERGTFFAIVATLTAFEVAGDWVLKGALVVDPPYAAGFGLALVLYLAVGAVERSSRILHVPRR